MIKNNKLMSLLLGMIALCGLYNTPARGVDKTGPKATPTAQPAKRILAKPAIPSTSKTYTVQQLLNLINSNNPNQSSEFIVAAGKSGTLKATDKITGIVGSQSASRASLASTIQSNLNTSVKLNADPDLIELLVKNGVLDSTTQTQYSKILLYFTLNGYRFYLNDPNPGHIVRSAGVVRSPAAQIINKWDFNKSF